MKALLLAEVANSLYEGTMRAATAVAKLSGQFDVLALGQNMAGVGEKLAKLHGVEQVFVVDDPQYAYWLAEDIASILSGMMANYDYLVGASSVAIRGIFPRVAAQLDVGQLSDVTAIIAPDTFERPTYAGNAIELVKSSDLKKVITIRASAFPIAAEGGKGKVTNLPPGKPFGKTRFVSMNTSKTARPELGSAKVVVSGGRALQNAENFQKYLEPLADKLGAAIGASRAAVDAGFVANDLQVGQTGKIVAPELYIAIGISGAIQHLAGMKESKIIVAINKDENAPIFQVADFGLVEDIFTALPEFVAQLDKIK